MYLQIHLFDIDIPGKITFIESKTLTAGQSPTIVDTGLFVINLLLYSFSNYIVCDSQSAFFIIFHEILFIVSWKL